MDSLGLKCAGRIRSEGELTKRIEEAPPKLHLVGFSDASTVLLHRRIRKKVISSLFQAWQLSKYGGKVHDPLTIGWRSHSNGLAFDNIAEYFAMINDNNNNIKNESSHLTGLIHYCCCIINISCHWHFLLRRNFRKKRDFRVGGLILFNCLERNERTISEEEKKCLLKSASTVVWYGVNMCVSVCNDVVMREGRILSEFYLYWGSGIKWSIFTLTFDIFCFNNVIHRGQISNNL